MALQIIRMVLQHRCHLLYEILWLYGRFTMELCNPTALYMSNIAKFQD